MNILEVMKRRWYIFVLCGFVVLGLIFRVFTSTPKQTSWNGLTFGKSTQQDVQKRFGPPIGVEKKEDNTSLSYKSDYPPLPTQIILKDDKLQLVIERVPLANAKNYGNLFESLGSNYFIQYTPYYNELFPLYVFSDQGIAIARGNSGSVFEIWHFPPMLPETFVSTLGKENSSTPFVTHDFPAPTPIPETK